MNTKNKFSLITNGLKCFPVLLMSFLPSLTTAQERMVIIDPDLSYVPLIYPDELQQQHVKRKSEILEKRRVPISDVPRIDFVTRKMNERREIASQNGLQNSFEYLGFYNIETDHEKNKGKLRYQPKLLSEQYLTRDSSSYLAIAGNILKQVHYKTSFGNIIIDEHNDTETVLDTPNATVLGYPATIHQAEYNNGATSTIVYIAMDNRAVVVEADGVNENNQDSFLAMVETLVR